MGKFHNFKHSLILPFLIILIIRTSWSVEVATKDGQNPATVNSKSPIDERISDLIADNILNFAHNLALKLAALDPQAENSEIFSPLSIMTVLSFLMLGAKGKSYQELKQLLALDSDSELMQKPAKFHEEFGKMLHDLENSNLNNDGVYRRSNANWRSSIGDGSPLRVINSDDPVTPHIIRVANGLFLQTGNTLNPDYKHVIETIYKSTLRQLDFQNDNSGAVDYINEWINKATFGKITKLIDADVDEATNIIIASAIYFKAYWENTFLYGYTGEGAFYPDGHHNPAITVHMMHNAGIFPFYNAYEYDCSIIGFPYKGNETTMYVIKPNNSTRQRLRELQNVLNATKINEMIDNMEYNSAVVIFPKMHFSRSFNMKDILRKMNIQHIFETGSSDFSLIGGESSVSSLIPDSTIILSEDESKSSSNRTKHNVADLGKDAIQNALLNLETDRSKVDTYRANNFVGEIMHKVDFSVDELGTEAAADTATQLYRTGPEIVFNADTPFLILLRHDPTKLPLFYGIINKPEL